MAKWTYSLDELPADMSDKVGLKCANLSKLRKAGFQAPNGFVITLQGYEEFLRKSGAMNEIEKYLRTFNADPDKPSDIARYDEASSVIRELMETSDMPADLKAEITERYESLCSLRGVTDLPVATRSSGPASHPGQYETFLHVSGKADVILHVVRVWSSTFNQRSLISRHRLGLPLNSDPIGVAVIQMVNAKTAGVLFTLNPLNGDPSKIMIEANWGLGESVVGGSTTPDKWTIDKVTFEIIQKLTSSKLVEYALDVDSGKPLFLDIPEERRNVASLSEEEAIELTRKGKLIERHFGVAQDIEWAIEKNAVFPDNIFFIQARPARIEHGDKDKPVLGSKKTAFDLVSDIATFGKL